jgi:RNA polymerase sigma-70 factor (ECF subfamily)
MAIRADVLRRVRDRLAAPLPTPAETEDRLTAAFAAARSFAADARVTAEQFALYLADRLPPDSDLDAQLRQRALGDLYLACGCFHGDAAALAELERSVLPRAGQALARLSATAEEQQEARQRVREKVLVGTDDDGPRIAQYAGEGGLHHWLAVALVRELLMMRRGRREIHLPPALLDDVVDTGIAADPELLLLRRTYGEALREAFRAAFAALRPAERNLLRYHTIDRLSIDEPAPLLGVGRSTAARHLLRAREALVAGTRAELKARLQVATETLQSILALVESEVHVHVREVFDAAVADSP